MSEHSRRWVVAVALAGTMLPAGAAAQGFEGVIRMRTITVGRAALEQLGATTPEAVFAVPLERILSIKPADEDEAPADVAVTDEFTFSVKGSMLRSDPRGTPDSAWYFVVDLARGTWFSVQPARRRYVELVPEQEEEARRLPRGAVAPAGRARPLGATKTLAGLRATGYEVRSESEIIRGWMAPDRELAALVGALNRLAKRWAGPDDEDAEADIHEPLWAHGFPMLVQTLSVEEDEITGYEIEETVSIERRALPATLFAVPAGYQKVSIEQMFEEAQPRKP